MTTTDTPTTLVNGTAAAGAIDLASAAGIQPVILYPGRGEGELLRLGAPLSFWGGIDPTSGLIIDARHPDRGTSIAGRVLAMAATIGSSSSSSVLLELIRIGRAPAAIVLGRADAILVVGCLVAREMGLTAPPVMTLDPAAIARLPAGRYGTSLRDGPS